jgi:hypothetical protein
MHAFVDWTTQWNREQTKERRFSAVQERIRFITHKGKQILLTDFSNCSANEVARIARAIPEYVTVQPRDSVLLLTDFTKASFDVDAMRAIKESAVFDKPYIKRSAWYGAESLPKDFEQNLKNFSRRQFPIFKSREEALTWLIED